MQEAHGSRGRHALPHHPHIGFELWKMLGKEGDIGDRLAGGDETAMVPRPKLVVNCQINGKMHDKLTVPAEIKPGRRREAGRSRCLGRSSQKAWPCRKGGLCTGKLLNIVAN